MCHPLNRETKKKEILERKQIIRVKKKKRKEKKQRKRIKRKRKGVVCWFGTGGTIP